MKEHCNLEDGIDSDSEEFNNGCGCKKFNQKRLDKLISRIEQQDKRPFKEDHVYLACMYDRHDILTYLFDHSTKIKDEEKIFRQACCAANLDTIKYLHKKGLKWPKNATWFVVSHAYDHPEKSLAVLKYMIEDMKDTDYDVKRVETVDGIVWHYQTPLEAAAQYGNYDIFVYLVSQGAVVTDREIGWIERRDNKKMLNYALAHKT